MKTAGLLLLGGLGAYVAYSYMKQPAIKASAIGPSRRYTKAVMPQSPYGGYLTGQYVDQMGNLIYGNSGLPASLIMGSSNVDDTPTAGILDPQYWDYTGDQFVGPLLPDLSQNSFYDGSDANTGGIE